MSIYLIRHGETALNASRTLQPADTPLSPRGLAQAAAIGSAWSMPVSSRSSAATCRAGSDGERDRRGLRAADPLGAAAARAQLRRSARPAYDGLAFDPLTLDGGTARRRIGRDFPGPRREAFKRIVALRASLDGNLAVVTHGLVIGAMLEAHARLAERDALPERLGNASLTVLSALPPHEVGLLDCTRHLEAVAADDARSLSGG